MAIVYPQLQGLDAAQVPFVFSPPSPNPALNETDMMQQQGIVSAARRSTSLRVPEGSSVRPKSLRIGSMTSGPSEAIEFAFALREAFDE